MRWFCRSHPEKKYKAPGKCPICQRYLVIIQEELPIPGMSNMLIPEGFDPAKFKKLPAPSQNMLKRISSSRQRSPQSLTTFSEISVRFFDTIGEVRKPTEQDWHDYFMVRRRQGVSERTLAKEFYCLKKLADTNHYGWPFEKEDAPHPIDDAEVPFFLDTEVEKLIKSWPLLSTTERFYLACSTVWGLRSIELIAIRKRDFDDKTITFHKSKREKSPKRLIPDELKPLFAGTKPSLSSKQAASNLFDRVCNKAGVKRKPRQSWHSLKHNLTNVISTAVSVNALDQSLIGAWMGWSRSRAGQQFGGSAMVGTYRNLAASTGDPYFVDHQILPIHPFLKLWKGVTPQEKPN